MSIELHLLALPKEMVNSIFLYLDAKSMATCATVSKQMREIVETPFLWKGVFVKVLPRIINGQRGLEPDARLWSSCAVWKDRMYIYGGHTRPNVLNDVRDDLYEFNFETRIWSKITPKIGVGQRTEHKCITYQDKLWFIGGYNNYRYTNDIHTLDLNSLQTTGETALSPTTETAIATTKVSTTGEIFSPRSALTAVLYKDKIYTFGGWNGGLKIWYNDLHELDLVTLNWRKVNATGSQPGNRTSHTAVVYKNCMYIFAGYSGTQYLNDFYEYNFDTEVWTNLTPLVTGRIPSPRSRLSAVVYGNMMYVLGGWDKVSFFADLHTYNFDTKVWTAVEPRSRPIPSLSQYASTVYKDKMFIFGGFDARVEEAVNSLYVYRLFDEYPSSNENNHNLEVSFAKIVSL